MISDCCFSTHAKATPFFCYLPLLSEKRATWKEQSLTTSDIRSEVNKEMTASPSKHYGHQLPKNMVDNTAQRSPQLLYVEVPLPSVSFDGGFRTITYGLFANAVNGMAWSLEQTIGPGKNFKPLSYIGLPDLWHNILLSGGSQ